MAEHLAAAPLVGESTASGVEPGTRGQPQNRTARVYEFNSSGPVSRTNGDGLRSAFALFGTGVEAEDSRLNSAAVAVEDDGCGGRWRSGNDHVGELDRLRAVPRL